MYTIYYDFLLSNKQKYVYTFGCISKLKENFVCKNKKIYTLQKNKN